jgi:hypothetical protein
MVLSVSNREHLTGEVILLSGNMTIQVNGTISGYPFTGIYYPSPPGRFGDRIRNVGLFGKRSEVE